MNSLVLSGVEVWAVLLWKLLFYHDNCANKGKICSEKKPVCFHWDFAKVNISISDIKKELLILKD